MRRTLPVGEANDAIGFDITITFSERRCVFRFAHTETKSDRKQVGDMA